MTICDVAIGNRSQLEDERMTASERVRRKFGVTWIDDTSVFAPVGHVYSVIVEQLGIKNPDLRGFIAELNEYIKIGGDGFACVEGPGDHFYSRTIHKLGMLLYDKVRENKMTNEQAYNIMFSAYGDHDAMGGAAAFFPKPTRRKFS